MPPSGQPQTSLQKKEKFLDRPSRSRRKKHPASRWLLRLAILPLGFALLALATPTVWGQLAPQPDAPPGQGEANFPPLSQPAQAQPQTQPAAPTQPQLNSQPPSTPAQPRATPSQSEQGASPEHPNNPQSTASPGVSTLRVSVNLVDLFFVVHDKSGKLVPNLTRADCNVFEDNAPQKLKSFTAQTDLPLSIGILLDTSLSQERVLPDEQKAASAFLRRILRPTDESFPHFFRRHGRFAGGLDQQPRRPEASTRCGADQLQFWQLRQRNAALDH